MSYWYQPKKEDLDYSLDGEDLHIYLYNDDSGAVYASVNLEVLNEFLKTAPKK